MFFKHNPQRLVLEVEAMKECYGDGPNSPKLCFKEGRLWWAYTLNVEGSKLNIKIEYPSSYPDSPPTIWVAPDQLPGNTPHIRSGNEMCWLYSESSRTRNKWNGTKDTAALCVGVAYRWFTTFLVWQATGDWVIPDAVKF